MRIVDTNVSFKVLSEEEDLKVARTFFQEA
jgi:hypothetical protein